jgi:O-methyltransferase
VFVVLPLLKRFLRRTLPRPLLERAEDLRWLGLPVPFRTVRPHTMLSNLNLFFLQELARRLERLRVPGDFVETGVCRGGSAGVIGYELIRSAFPRRLWLYDVFTGSPSTSDQDEEILHSLEGTMVGSEEQTRRLLERLGVPEDRYRIVAGLIEETLPRSEISSVALLHVDCNLYSPVKATLEVLYDRVEPLGFVVLNDYGCYRGCRKAVDEFLQKLPISPPVLQIDQDAWYFQKPAPIPTPGGNGTGTEPPRDCS